MGFLHCSICPPYVEIKKKLWNTSLVPIQWAKPYDATKIPQLLCVKLEDPKKFTSQALRRSRAVIHLALLAAIRKWNCLIAHARGVGSSHTVTSTVRIAVVEILARSVPNITEPLRAHSAPACGLNSFIIFQGKDWQAWSHILISSSIWRIMPKSNKGWAWRISFDIACLLIGECF